MGLHCRTACISDADHIIQFFSSHVIGPTFIPLSVSHQTLTFVFRVQFSEITPIDTAPRGDGAVVETDYSYISFWLKDTKGLASTSVRERPGRTILLPPDAIYMSEPWTLRSSSRMQTLPPSFQISQYMKTRPVVRLTRNPQVARSAVRRQETKLHFNYNFHLAHS